MQSRGASKSWNEGYGDMTTIGHVIYELRKSKDITQENLATAVGVTPQAVSKWESGGTPDVELLLQIADYFGVSLDYLFGRGAKDYSQLEHELAKALEEIPYDQKFKKALSYCWAIEQGIMGIIDNNISVDEISVKHPTSYSQMLFNDGFSTMAFHQGLQYFLLMPEPPNGWKPELGYKDEYAYLFEFLGDKNALKVVYFLYERENKPFTPKLVQKIVTVDEGEANRILDRLLELRFVWQSVIELDDEVKTVFNFTPNPAFVALIAMCKELLHKPNHFYCNSSSRSKPYFENK